jgi:hypothetical protein
MMVALVFVGYVGGLLSFKIRTRWCGTCGTVKSCPNCTGWAAFAALPGAVAVDRPDRARRTGHGVDQRSTRTGAGWKGGERR